MREKSEKTSPMENKPMGEFSDHLQGKAFQKLFYGCFNERRRKFQKEN